MLLLWQQTPPPVGLPLLFSQGDLGQQGATLPPVVVTWSVGEGQDGISFGGTVQQIVSGSLAINERKDVLSFAGNVKNSGSLLVNERKDNLSFVGNVRNNASLAINERRDTVLFNGSVIQNSVTGALVITERRDSVKIAGFIPTVSGHLGDAGSDKRYKKYREKKERLRKQIEAAYEKQFGEEKTLEQIKPLAAAPSFVVDYPDFAPMLERLEQIEAQLKNDEDLFILAALLH